MADTLCDNYLVNTKVFYAQSVYGHTDAVIDLLGELGARGVRERLTTGTSRGTKNQLYAMPKLAGRGTKWHATIGLLEDWANATAVNRSAMSFLKTNYGSAMGGDLTALMHSFGGCNEVDNGGNGPDWAPHARAMQKALWEQANSDSRTSAIPVAGPSTRTDFTASKAALLGDLSQWSDLGNGHLYNKGTSPTQGIDAHLDILRPCFPGISDYIFTETGYNNSPADELGKPVPEFASAIYAVRGICDFFKRRSVYGRFELLDDPDHIDYTSQETINATAERQAHFGLVAMTEDSVLESTPDTWRKKAEFYSTKHLLGLLADPGPVFTPTPLAVSVTGGGTDLQQVLLQKRSGKHYLVLWRDVKVSETYPEATRIQVDPVRVHIALKTARPIRFYIPTRSATPVRAQSARTDFDLDMRGELKVLEIG